MKTWLLLLLLLTSSPVPRDARRFLQGVGEARYYEVPSSPYRLLFQGKALSLLRQPPNGLFYRCSLSSLDWDCEGLEEIDVQPLRGTDWESGLVVASRGDSIRGVVLPAGLRGAGRSFSFEGGNASAMACVGYRLGRHQGETVVEEVVYSAGEERPDGSHVTDESVSRIYRWNGRDFR